jgi:hypothetical protein
MAEVLRRMGLQEQAVRVLIAKNREHGRHPTGFNEVLWYVILGPSIAFGYHPFNAFYASLAVILFGYFRFRRGEKDGVIIPTRRRDAYGDDREGVNNLYPNFNAFIFSLEHFVPLVKMGVAEYWMPNANRGKKIHGLRQLLLMWVVKWGFGKSNGKYRFRKWNRSLKFSPSTRGASLRNYLWCHICLGWALTTLWVGGLTGLIKTWDSLYRNRPPQMRLL